MLSGAYGVLRAIRNAGFATILAISPVLAEPATVLALGDSLTQGYGLPPDDGFVPQLQRWLGEHGADAVVVNGGVSGDTTAGGLSRIGWSLTDDVDAVIVALGGNDMLRGIDPAVARANLDGILKEIDARDLPVLLIGMDAPPNYGAEYEADFDAMYPDLAEQYGALYEPDFLGALAAMDDREATLRDYMQGDAIHPNAEGVALIVEAVGPRVLELLERVAE